VNEFNPNVKVIAVEIALPAVTKAAIGIIPADAPVAPKGPRVSVEGYGYESLPLSADDPHNIETARQHRDGIDSFCSLLEWRLSNSAHWDSAKEHGYQERRQEEIKFWRAFLTPTENCSVANMRKRVQKIWGWPIAYGRRWSATTIATAITELELKDVLEAA
jgi:hypothetical protein